MKLREEKKTEWSLLCVGLRSIDQREPGTDKILVLNAVTQSKHHILSLDTPMICNLKHDGLELGKTDWGKQWNNAGEKHIL